MKVSSVQLYKDIIGQGNPVFLCLGMCRIYICLYVCVYIYMYMCVYMYVCIYMYVCVYIYIYIYIPERLSNFSKVTEPKQ